LPHAENLDQSTSSGTTLITTCASHTSSNFNDGLDSIEQEAENEDYGVY
jgi:hypothetical protein